MFKKLSLLILFVLMLSACSGAATTPTPTATTASEPEAVEPTEEAPAEPAGDPTPYPPPQQNLPLVGQGEAYPAPATPITSPGAYPEVTEAPTVAAEAVESPAECAEAFEFTPGYTVAAEDGLQITGDLYTPTSDQPLPAIVTTHMLSTDRTVWGSFPEELAKACYVVFNIDMRGHGETGGEVNWQLAQQDMQQVLQALSELDAVAEDHLALIGASIGANVALNAGADNPAVNTVVLLSPGLDYAGVTTVDALQRYGERPLLIVASDEDSYAADSSRQLADTAVGEVDLVMYSGAGHGTAMFNSEPGLQQTILDWLAEHLQ